MLFMNICSEIAWWIYQHVFDLKSFILMFSPPHNHCLSFYAFWRFNLHIIMTQSKRKVLNEVLNEIST